MMNTIALALAPIFFVSILGYGAGALRIIDNKNVDGLNSVVMRRGLACVFVGGDGVSTAR
jgi:malonate transporter